MNKKVYITQNIVTFIFLIVFIALDTIKLWNSNFSNMWVYFYCCCSLCLLISISSLFSKNQQGGILLILLYVCSIFQLMFNTMICSYNILNSYLYIINAVWGCLFTIYLLAILTYQIQTKYLYFQIFKKRDK